MQQREASPDRVIFSVNDWYGEGCLREITQADSHAPGEKVWWYCGRGGAYEQYGLGQTDIQRIDLEESMRDAT